MGASQGMQNGHCVRLRPPAKTFYIVTPLTKFDGDSVFTESLGIVPRATNMFVVIRKLIFCFFYS